MASLMARRGPILPGAARNGALGVLLAGVALMAQPLAAQDTHLLVVGGLGGDAEYRGLFHEWATTLVDAAVQAGVSEERITYLSEKPERDAATIDGESRKEDVSAAIDALAESTASGDVVFIVLIGHGSFRDSEARFNLPGPDLTAAEYAKLLEGLAGRDVVFVNSASASGPFVEALSGPGRTVITATRSGTEKNQTRFGGYFVDGLANAAADTDKNGRVSVLEAFTYARLETERSYETANRLATEHALLDDNGDGEGSGEPSGDGDGSRAGALYFGTGQAAVLAEQSGDSVLVRLQSDKRALEGRIQELRGLQGSLAPDVYQQRLEDLLVELALVDRSIRERAGGG